MIDHILVLFLALGVSFFAYKVGVRHGRHAENLRVQWIFGLTTEVIYGGAIKVVWEHVDGRITREEMLDRLRESQERKDREKKRLASYEAEYGRAPIDLEGESE